MLKKGGARSITPTLTECHFLPDPSVTNSRKRDLLPSLCVKLERWHGSCNLLLNHEIRARSSEYTKSLSHIDLSRRAAQRTAGLRSTRQQGLRLAKSPTVRWRAPRIGTPSFYILHDIRVAKLPDRGTPTNTAAHFLTTETEVHVPEGVLLPDAQYFFEVIACGSSEIDPQTAPRRASLLADETDTAHLCSALLQITP